MLRHKHISTTQRYIETGLQSMKASQKKVAELMGLQKAEPPPKPAKAAPRTSGSKKGNKAPSKPRQC